MGERIVYWKKKMAGWISAVTRRTATQFHSAEDLEQEAQIQIWRCLDGYPGLSDHDFIGLFKACFCRRLASLLGQERSKRKMISISGEVSKQRFHKGELPDYTINLEAPTEHPEIWYEEKIRDLVALCEDPQLKRWIDKNLTPGRYGMNGMKRHEMASLRELVDRVF